MAPADQLRNQPGPQISRPARQKIRRKKTWSLILCSHSTGIARPSIPAGFARIREGTPVQRSCDMILKEVAEPLLLGRRFDPRLIDQNSRGAGEILLIRPFQSQVGPDAGHPHTECLVIGQLTQSQMPEPARVAAGFVPCPEGTKPRVVLLVRRDAGEFQYLPPVTLE